MQSNVAKYVIPRKKCAANFWCILTVSLHSSHKICPVGEHSSRNTLLVRIEVSVTAVSTTRYVFVWLSGKRVFGSFCYRLFIVDRHHDETFVQITVFIAPSFFQRTPCFFCEMIMDWSIVVSPSSALFRQVEPSLSREVVFELKRPCFVAEI